MADLKARAEAALPKFKLEKVLNQGKFLLLFFAKGLLSSPIVPK